MNILGWIFKKKEIVVSFANLKPERDRAEEIASALWFGGDLNPTEEDQKRLLIEMDDWGIGFGQPFDWSKPGNP